MGSTLIDTAREMITPEMAERAASATGESPDNVHKAMRGAVPTVFAGLAQHAESPGGSSRMFEMLKEGPGGEAAPVGGVGGAEMGERGSSLLGNIFGDRSSHVTNALASSSGIKSSSASMILGFVAPMVTGLLGKEVRSRGLDAGGLGQLITSHRSAITGDPALPSGLSEAMGIGQRPEVAGVRNITEEPRAIAGEARRNVREAGRDVREFGRETGRDIREGGHGVHRIGEAARDDVRRTRWGTFLAVIAGGLLVAWGMVALSRAHAPKFGVTEMQPHLSMRPPRAPGMPAPGGGPTVNAPAGSPEADLEHAMNDASVPLPYTAKLDKLTFDKGSDVLSREAKGSVGTVATILRAHPSARVRVEGFTDGVGNPGINKALSKARAESVKATLVSKGVPGGKVEVAGQGVSGPAENATEQEQAFNRRAEIQVLSR
jgi:outer membrane protein OmpA-like peptidoglycan-associated protein